MLKNIKMSRRVAGRNNSPLDLEIIKLNQTEHGSQLESRGILA
jgi:hypothetical protein